MTQYAVIVEICRYETQILGGYRSLSAAESARDHFERIWPDNVVSVVKMPDDSGITSNARA